MSTRRSTRSTRPTRSTRSTRSTRVRNTPKTPKKTPSSRLLGYTSPIGFIFSIVIIIIVSVIAFRLLRGPVIKNPEDLRPQKPNSTNTSILRGG